MPTAAPAVGTGVLGLLVLAERPGVLTFRLSCWPNSALSTSAGPKPSTGLGGSSVMDAVKLGVMGLVIEVPCWLGSAASSSCTGVTDALLPRTASNTERYGKSAGTSDSLSDSRTASLLLSLSTICLHWFFKAFISPCIALLFAGTHALLALLHS